MTFFQILDSLLFQPLQLLFEVIYVNANRVIGNPGLSIIVLSLVMNFLVLPLYMRADALQEEERDMEARLHRGVTHIKKTFRELVGAMKKGSDHALEESKRNNIK